jgi:hypothetical protein
MELNGMIGWLVDLLRLMWPAEMTGPMWLQTAIATLRTAAGSIREPGTAVMVPRLLIEPSYRKQRVEHFRRELPPTVLEFWNIWDQMSDYHRSETRQYFSCRFDQFANDPAIRNVFGQCHSTVRIRDIMDEGKVLLVRTGRGQVSPVSASFTMAMLMSRILAAALAREAVPAERRRFFTVYCDEFQRLTSPSTPFLLSEARKFGVALVLANQYAAQLSAEVLGSLLGNVGTSVCFRLCPDDAARLAPFMEPWTQTELARLPNFTATVSMLAGGTRPPAFTLRTALPRRPRSPVAPSDAVRELARLKYGRNRAIVEAELGAYLRE